MATPPIQESKLRKTLDRLIATKDLLGPVFAYEIVRVGRRNSTFLLRCAYLLLLCLAFYVAYQGWTESLRYPGSWQRRPARLSDYSSFGTMLFSFFIVLQFAVLVLLTPATMAGTIAVEKERKTLEFMLATDLRNHEIIFGKLVARFINLLTYLLAGLPILGISLLFGGIDPNQLLAAYGATLLSVIGLSALSIFFSTRQKRSRDAIALTYVVATGYVVVTLFAGMYLRYALPRTMPMPMQVLGMDLPLLAIADWLNAGNPIYAAMHAMGPAMMRASMSLPDLVLRYTFFHLGGGALLTGYSILKLRKIAIQQAGGGGEGQAKRKSGKAKKDKPDIGENPILWRELFCETKRRTRSQFLAWTMLVAIIFVWPLVLFLAEFTKWDFGDNFFATIASRMTADRWNQYQQSVSVWVRIATGAIGFLLMMAAALRGAGAITQEYDRDTWISLMASPIHPQEFLFGKWMGCVFGMRPVLIMLLLVWGVGLFLGAIQPIMIPLLVVFLFVYVSAFALAGMYCSATARNTLIATTRALMLAAFMSGAHFLVTGLCCLWPLSWGPNSSSQRELSSQLASAFAGQVPAFVLGWLPLPSFEKRDMGIFHEDATRSIGLASPVLGFIVWVLLNLVSLKLTLRRTARAMNRIPLTRSVKEDGPRKRKLDLEEED